MDSLEESKQGNNDLKKDDPSKAPRLLACSSCLENTISIAEIESQQEYATFIGAKIFNENRMYHRLDHNSC